MSGTLTAAEATPAQIYALLHPGDLILRLPIPWSEALRLGRRDMALGEISGADDLAQLPVHVHVRAVGLITGDVITIRWLNPEKVRRVLPGDTHDYLLSQEDQPEETHSGWLVRTDEGVEVQ